MLRAEPITILRFLVNYFDIIRDLFQSQGIDGYIKKEVLAQTCEKYGSDIKSQLVDYKILKPQNDDFEIRQVYYDFIEFLLFEFRPLLPETIEKYHTSISELFRKLKDGVNGDRNILSERIENLIHQIREFIESVEKNTIRLLSETRELKANIKKIDYRQKLQKASFWIDYYIVPLNRILDIKYSGSIAHKLADISEFTNVKRLNFYDENIRIQFERLYNMLIQTNDDLLAQAKVLTNELLPLIERIKTESAILTGWIEFLRKPSQYETPKLQKGNMGIAYSTDIYLKTKEFFEQFLQNDSIFIDEDDFEVEKWIFDKAHYKSKLKSQLPVNDFFTWCSEILNQDYKQIEIDKLFALTGLLFEDDWFVEFSEEKEYVDIKSNNNTLKVPIIKIYPNAIF